MRFSIIVPVYNVEKYLERCLDSIVNQTYRDFEVILVDDGSTDSSGNICDEYEQTYGFIKVIHQKNQGVSGARNTGLKHAKGEWIVFVDSDDWISVNMLEVLAKEIKKTDAELYSFNMQKVAAKEEVVEKLIWSIENDMLIFRTEEQKFEYYFDNLMQYKPGWEVCGRIFLRKIIERNHLSFVDNNQVFAEDYLFTFQYLLYVRKIATICNILYNYYQRDDSLIHNVAYDSVLPRLYHWAEVGYQSVCNKHLKILKRRYAQLYFQLLNYHIQYTLAETLSCEEIKKQLQDLFRYRNHRKWMSKLCKEKNQYEKYMERVEWL